MGVVSGEGNTEKINEGHKGNCINFISFFGMLLRRHATLVSISGQKDEIMLIHLKRLTFTAN